MILASFGLTFGSQGLYSCKIMTTLWGLIIYFYEPTQALIIDPLALFMTLIAATMSYIMSHLTALIEADYPPLSHLIYRYNPHSLPL